MYVLYSEGLIQHSEQMAGKHQRRCFGAELQRSKWSINAAID